jgi:UDP-N-acetylglucosamine--N-acetylmuramyl-(pentapeptide) pyrophosphoryl-undecaprenol N-acetylglucosamine transferase
MRIVLTGSSTGGHFYPLIAVAQALREHARDERIVNLELIMMGETPPEPGLLWEHDITFQYVPAGKVRRYISFKNISDTFRTIRGIFQAILLFTLKPPDVVFAKGGYDTFPILIASRLFRVPVMIHESDAAPGVVNKWAGSFATRVAVAFPQAASFFAKEKTAVVGNPIRKSVLGGIKEEALALFRFRSDLPVILVLGGSQGARPLNDVIIPMLAEALGEMQMIHQCGRELFPETLAEVDVVLEESPHRSRYRLLPFLDAGELRNASRIADVVVARSGSMLFEIAAWNIPALLIPLPHAAQDHQRANAYAYARSGAAEVIEEANLKPNLLLAEIRKLVSDKDRIRDMRLAAQKFARLDAADKIADELLKLGIHE